MTLYKKHSDFWNRTAVEMFDRWLPKSQWMKWLAPYMRHGSILDVGCGQGILYELLPEIRTRYAGMDTSPEMLDFFKSRYPEVLTYRLDVTDKREWNVDNVVCLDMLMYFDEGMIEDGLKILYAMANRTLIFNVPITDGETFKDNDHITFNKTYIDNLVDSLGAAVKTREGAVLENQLIFILDKEIPEKLNEPKISVITPCYNQGAYLQEAIDSVKRQTYPVWNYEHIIINDGSTDESERIMYENASDRTLPVNLPKQSSIAAVLNAGIGKMRGEIFVWVPADDLIRPDLLEKKLRFSMVCEKNAVIYSNFEHINHNGGKMGDVLISKTEPQDFFKRCYEQCFIGFTGVWIPRICFEQVGIFPEHYPYCEDYFWMLKASKMGIPFHGMSDILYSKRLHDNRSAVRNKDGIAEMVKKIKAEIDSYA